VATAIVRKNAAGRTAKILQLKVRERPSQGGRFTIMLDELENRVSADIAACLKSPQISLLGEVLEEMVEAFLSQLAEAEKGDGDIALQITTPGGDAELGRRMVLEVEEARNRLGNRRFLFLGKTQVYSAGVTLMSAFPCKDRYLTRDTVLLIHGRQLEETVEITGPIRASLAKVQALQEQIKVGLAHEEENFRRLIDDCDISMDELCEKALHNWYLPADQALKRGLVAGLI
jgi:ATP-dependent Clp protease, protease subunit